MLRKFWAIKKFTDGSQRLCLLREMAALEGHATFPLKARDASVKGALKLWLNMARQILWNVEPEWKRTNGAPH